MAIDPGKVCGYIIYETDKKKLEGTFKIGKKICYHLNPCVQQISTSSPYGITLVISHSNDENPIDLIILEKFICSRVTNKSFIETIECIGIIKYIANQRSIMLIEQNPSVKKFFDDKKLKKLGHYRTNPHEKDAVRHLLYYLKFKSRNKK